MTDKANKPRLRGVWTWKRPRETLSLLETLSFIGWKYSNGKMSSDCIKKRSDNCTNNYVKTCVSVASGAYFLFLL